MNKLEKSYLLIVVGLCSMYLYIINDVWLDSFLLFIFKFLFLKYSNEIDFLN